MPRNALGVYTLPAGNPTLPGTKVSSTWANTTLADIAQALTDSLAIDGSVTPAKLSNDPAGFQAKLQLTSIIADAEAAVSQLELRNSSEVGSVSMHGIASGVPSHFLLCDGAAYSRATYSKLFAKIGTTWGGGDGTTTFNVPDLRDEWVYGRSAGKAVGATQAAVVPTHTHAASTGSAGTHSHTATTASGGAHSHSGSTNSVGDHNHTWSGSTGSNNVGHTHTFSATTSTAAAHTHTYPYSQSSAHDANSSTVYAPGSGANYTSSSSGAHAHTASGTTAGNNVSHTHTYSGTAQSTGAHTHTITVTDGGAHTHSFTSASAGSHSHTVTLDSTGGENRVRNVALAPCIKYE